MALIASIVAHFLRDANEFADMAITFVMTMIAAASYSVIQAELEYRKRGLTAYEESQFFMLSVDMLCVASVKDGTFKKVNPAFEKVLGYSPNEMCTRPLMDFIHPDDHAKTVVAVEEQEGGVSIHAFENRYRCKDGSYRLISWKSVPYGDLMYGVGRDVTDVKLAEEQKIQSQALLEAIVENMPQMLFIKDARDLKFIHFNRAGAELIGLTPESFIGKSDADFFSKEEADFFNEKGREVLASGKTLDIPEEKLNSKRHGEPGEVRIYRQHEP